MVKTSANRFELSQVAQVFGLTSEAFLEKVKGYNDELPEGDRLSERWFRDLPSRGVSFRNRGTRSFLRNFAEAKFPNDDQLPRRVAEALFEQIDESLLPEAFPFAKEALSEDSELFQTVAHFLAIRGDDSNLHEERADYSGHYRLVRKTTQPNASFYYEEPFFIGARGDTSYLIPTEQGPNLGFSFSSRGTCTSILFHRHRTKTVGVRVIMLYADGNPGKTATTGVMLRLSDTQYRPVASQVLARRCTDQTVIEEWDTGITTALDAEGAGDREAILRTRDELHSLTREIHDNAEHGALFRIYEAFELKSYAKAFDRVEWSAVLDKLKISNDELDNLLRT